MPTLAVIAKSPGPGRVKTRLSPPCTPAQAARLARASLVDTLASVLATPVGRRVLVLDGQPGAWLPRDIEVIAQRGDGLGERLANAFADIGEPTFLVGMDTPQLSPELLAHGLRGLRSAPSTIGEAEDGGYWGIGLRRGDDRVFSGVPMSTPQTGAAQRTRLAALGYVVGTLPRLRDFDTFADARLVAAECPSSGFARQLRVVETELTAGVGPPVGEAA